MSFFMYVCPECKKIFKINGSGKKGKCPKCRDSKLVDTTISEEVWKTYTIIDKNNAIGRILGKLSDDGSNKLDKDNVINGMYKIIKPIGEGGTGDIFLAWHLNLKKNVVIKRIKDDFVGKVNERSEADILKKLHHRYLPQVYDFIQTGKEVYTVMDYIEGKTLKDYIDAKVRFNEAQIIKWLKQLCEALDYLHSQQPAIIHSDIKPSNIMVAPNGDVCLIDFNISFNEEDADQIAGLTKAYASPEQTFKAQTYAQGGNYREIKLDARSDIFSLGASIYHLMTLQNPLDVTNGSKSIWDVNRPMPYSKALADIMEKALQKNSNNRYQTASLMLNDLETIKLKDSRIKRLKKLQFVSNISLVIMVIIGSFMMFKGLNLKKYEGFDAEYKEIIELSENDEFEESSEKAMEVINAPKYRNVSKKRSKEYADLYYIIANNCFENEEYQEALPFYEDALKYDTNNPDYYRDYAIAYARSGDIDTAEKIAQEGISTGLKDDNLSLVSGEILAAKNDWDAAITEYQKVIDTTSSEKMQCKAYVLLSKAYRKKGDIEAAEEVLSDANMIGEDFLEVRMAREKGLVYIQYLEQGKNNKDVLEGACINFQYLVNSSKAIATDYLNYSLVTAMAGKQADAIDILDYAKTKISNEYRFYARSALYRIQEQDYENAKADYDKAEELFKKYDTAGNEDDDMYQLREMANDLKSRGLW